MAFTTLPISQGGTLKPSEQRTVVRRCDAHGDWLVPSDGPFTGCPSCGATGLFRGFTPDSVFTSDELRARRTHECGPFALGRCVRCGRVQGGA